MDKVIKFNSYALLYIVGRDYLKLSLSICNLSYGIIDWYLELAGIVVGIVRLNCG